MTDGKIPIVQLQSLSGDKVPATTSLAISEFTEIEHKHVMESVRKLIETGKFSESNYRLSTYQGTTNPNSNQGSGGV